MWNKKRECIVMIRAAGSLVPISMLGSVFVIVIDSLRALMAHPFDPMTQHSSGQQVEWPSQELRSTSWTSRNACAANPVAPVMFPGKPLVPIDDVVTFFVHFISLRNNLD